jgi:glycosyltransferase involved in cell wall biosynthesis
VRILVVSPYPPARDGIAAYTVQEVKRLRAEGHDVEVCSPWPSAAHHHLDLRRARGGLALARRARAYDRLVVAFHPEVFFPQPSTPGQRAARWAALAAALGAARRGEVVVHEFPHAGPETPSERAAARAMWRAADRIAVHTARERDELAMAFGLTAGRIEVIGHGAHFERRTRATRAEARAGLGVPDDAFVFLAIGFLQPHKGFDRAVRAFGRLGDHGCRLEIVGSLRVDEPEYRAHVDELRALAAATPGVTLHEEYVSDERFDTWIVAADALVLPYRVIWSSSVCGRAALYGRPVIATNVGGLGEQTGTTILVDGDRELAEAMHRLAGVGAPPQEAAAPWPRGREAVMGEIRERAARRRPTTGAASAPVVVSRRSAPLRRLRPLGAAPALSARPGATALKRLVARATAWQLDPIIGHVNRLREATIAALEGEEDGPGPAAGGMDGGGPAGA